MVRVISKVATLAHGEQVVVAAMLRDMIEMRDRQNDEAAGDWVGFAVFGRASLAVDFLLALVFCPDDTDLQRDLWPVFGIASSVFW